MKDEDFEKIMDAWASHEAKPMPGDKKGRELRPTGEMYRMMEAQKRKGLFPIYVWRVLVGLAIICLVLLVPIGFYLSGINGEPSIGLRQAHVAKKGVTIKNPPRRNGKGPKKMAISFRQLMFQYQEADSQSVYGVDIRFPIEEKITLIADDNYRLAIQLAGDRYVYIYQLDSRGILVKLFPNSVYSSIQNPLQQMQTYRIPSDPNWFHLGKKEGEERIYVVASAQPIPKLEELYVQYDEMNIRLKRWEILSLLLKELDGELLDEDIVVWKFEFSHQ